MQREIRIPRFNFQEKVEQYGLSFHTIDGKPYWNEAAAYVFDRKEIEAIESATNELHQMCLAAVEHVITTNTFHRFAIPASAHPVIRKAWETDPPSLYGRFDLCYNGSDPPKLLEYNADTHTSLLEAAVIQWHWLQDELPEADQFNSIWEGLTEKWVELKEENYFASGLIHFGCMDEVEDVMTTAGLMDTAKEAGFEVELLNMQDVGWDPIHRRFRDLYSREIETLFKLYPWECLLKDRFGEFIQDDENGLLWIEPIWKMILSNKAILAILWEMFPDHPNLLPAYLDGPRQLESYVKKPILGREGSNIEILTGQLHSEVPGPYGDQPRVWQDYAPLPVFDGNHAVIGAWVIDGVARGIGVRESDGPITEDRARFVPHYFLPDPLA